MINKCDLLVANLDGADVDSGTAWEIGYAYALKKSIVCIRTDFREHTKKGKVNLMVDKSTIKIFNNLKSLEKYLKIFKSKKS